MQIRRQYCDIKFVVAMSCPPLLSFDRKGEIFCRDEISASWPVQLAFAALIEMTTNHVIARNGLLRCARNDGENYRSHN